VQGLQAGEKVGLRGGEVWGEGGPGEGVQARAEFGG